MSASLLIDQASGMIHERLYVSPATKVVATVTNTLANNQIAIAHTNDVVLPMAVATFVSSNPAIVEMTAPNKFKINKSGRFRLKAVVNAGLPNAQDPFPVPDNVAVATIPVPSLFLLSFADANAIATRKGTTGMVYLNTNIVQQVAVDSVVNVVSGNEFSLVAVSSANTGLYGRTDAGPHPAPAVFVEVCEV